MEAYDNLMKGISEAVSAAIKSAGMGEPDISNDITMPEKGFGDISCASAFKLAKASGKSPKDVAELIRSSMKKPPMVSEITSENGFVNFHIDRKAFSRAVVAEALSSGAAIASSAIGKGSKVIIEYPSVNPNKPWHIGHLRNALLGDSIANMYFACGYSVEREDYIDDMGMQVVESLWGVQHGNGTPAKKYDHWLGELYVEVNRRLQEPGMKEELGKLLTLMERGDTYEAELARDMAEKCVMAQYETAFSYGIYHDVLIWESDIIRSRILDLALSSLERSGAVTKEKSGKYENCIVMDLEKAGPLPSSMKGLKEPVKVLMRSDGTAVYAAKDIAFHMWKFGLIGDPFSYKAVVERQPNGMPLYMSSREGEKRSYGNVAKAVNIIDIQQSYEQGIVKLAFQLLGKGAMAENLVHLAYNVVELESGSFSGRKGTWIGYTADDLLTEAKARAGKLISGRFKLDETDRERVTSAVALSAIKFEMLRVSPERKIIFSWDKALNFEGLSGPYCQYTYARASRILEGSQARPAGSDASMLTTDEEFALVKLISRCGQMVEKACSEHRSNVLTDYAGLLATAFSKFYEKVPVLKADSQELVSARLALVSSFRHAMKGVLSVMGIEALERM